MVAHQSPLDDLDCSLLFGLFVDASKDLPVGSLSNLVQQLILFRDRPFLDCNQLVNVNLASLK